MQWYRVYLMDIYHIVRQIIYTCECRYLCSSSGFACEGGDKSVTITRMTRLLTKITLMKIRLTYYFTALRFFWQSPLFNTNTSNDRKRRSPWERWLLMLWLPVGNEVNVFAWHRLFSTTAHLTGTREVLMVRGDKTRRVIPEWLVAWTAPCHYLNQCWHIVNWTLRNKLQWNFNRNSNILIQENAVESVVCQTAAILSRPQWVKLSI